MFLLVLTYKKTLEEVEEYLPAHVAFLDEAYARSQVIFSGRRTPRVGGVILLNVDSPEEASAFVKNDPFYQHEVAEFEVIEFTPTRCAEGFRRFIDK